LEKFSSALCVADGEEWSADFVSLSLLTKFVSFSANFNVQTFGGDCLQPRFVRHCVDREVGFGGERSLRVE